MVYSCTQYSGTHQAELSDQCPNCRDYMYNEHRCGIKAVEVLRQIRGVHPWSHLMRPNKRGSPMVPLNEAK